MVAAAGCSGLMLFHFEKMRVELKGFDIQIEAQMSEEHPNNILQ
jgi:putative redox protein